MKDADNVLWYTAPAKRWVQALPIGNGHLGAMVYGGVKHEWIALNHDELWSGMPGDQTVPGAAEVFLQARELAMKGALGEATKLLESNRFQSTSSDAYLPLGRLQITFDGKGKVTDYQRRLDLRTATAYTTYKQNGVLHERTCFASFPAGAIVYQVKAKKSFSCHISMASPLQHESTSEDGLLLLHGECPGEYRFNLFGNAYHYKRENAERGIRFLAGVRPVTDGVITAEKGGMHIQNAGTITLYFACETSFRAWNKHPCLEGKEYRAPVLERLKNVAAIGFAAIYQAHLTDYKALYGRVQLQLCGDSPQSAMPTNKRLRAYQKSREDLSLCTLLYNFGRYLAIAGSRPGTQALNLQGIWNDQKKPLWNANYTLNINTEMNYWPMLSSALPELNEPLLQMINELSQAGKKTARVHYGAPGFTVHHNSDIWRFSAPKSGFARWSFWPLGGVWLCRHLWEYYQYTTDTAFLRNTAYPVFKQAAEFCSYLLIADKNGHLIMAPSTSPENVFNYNGKKLPVAPTSTMTMALIRELFENLRRCFDILDIDDDFSKIVRRQLPKLLAPKIGMQGQLLEWSEAFDEVEPRHRHVSHLYALHPGNQIDPDQTPELANACRRTLELRGDGGTGWSLSWKIHFWARLRDGNHAFKLIANQLRPVRYAPQYVSLFLKGGVYPNLLGAHPPFQIDCNLGFVSGINEMLLQTPAEKTLVLLPALPTEWPNGRVEGLAAPGNLRVVMEWKQGKLSYWHITGNTNEVTIIYNKAVMNQSNDSHRTCLEGSEGDPKCQG